MTPKNNKPPFTLGDLSEDLGVVGEFEALRSTQIQRLSPVENCGASDLVFIAQESFLPALEKAKPAVFVVGSDLWDKASARKATAPLLHVKDAMVALAKVSRHFRSEAEAAVGVHPSAIVHPTALIGENVSIGAFVTVEEGAVLEAGVILHARVQIGARSRLGKDSVIFPGVVIYQDVVLGERVRVHANTVIGADGFGYAQERTATGVRHVKIHHLGGVDIGDDVEIGASSTIDRGTLGNTILEKGCIIDNQVQIGHNVHLEEGVVVCGCSGLAGSSHVEKFAVLAGFVGVANKVRVGTGAQVASFSAVTGNVPAGARWGGVPATLWRDFVRSQVYVSRLPDLFAKRKENGNS